METVTIDMAQQAAANLAKAAELAPMVRADHAACIQAVQILAKFFEQLRAPKDEKPKE